MSAITESWEVGCQLLPVFWGNAQLIEYLVWDDDLDARLALPCLQVLSEYQRHDLRVSHAHPHCRLPVRLRSLARRWVRWTLEEGQRHAVGAGAYKELVCVYVWYLFFSHVEFWLLSVLHYGSGAEVGLGRLIYRSVILRDGLKHVGRTPPSAVPSLGRSGGSLDGARPVFC